MNVPHRSPPRSPLRRAALAAVVALAALAGALAPFTGGCQQSPTLVPVRSLERSGKASFVCLSPVDPVYRPITDCTPQTFTSICQYEYTDDAGNADAQTMYADGGLIPTGQVVYPHLYALVTQTTRGELAVVDTSAQAGQVLDENPFEPGANFLHIGQLPTGIASTQGSVATFVGVAETGHAGIFAIPSSRIRPVSSFGVPDTCIGTVNDAGFDANIQPPQLTDWPACSLPAAPGDMILIDDPALPDGRRRLTCDAPYDQPVNGTDDPINSIEGSPGRPKLVMTLPSLGGIVVVDAQELFSRPAGSFSECTIERWLPLTVDISGLAGLPAQPGGQACSNPLPLTPPLKSVCASGGGADAGSDCYSPQPAGISYADGKLYIADKGAPVIHVVDMRGPDGTATPCDPLEEAPLLPTSVENTERVVFAGKVSAAPTLTPDFKRYLYATDVDDASAMVFDIGPDSTTRRPLVRAHPEWNPFQPRDRVKFSAPPADIVVVQNDVPAIDPATGVATGGVLCDPDPQALSCTSTSHNCDIGTSYRTAIDYSSGAGPNTLRGEFAFAALTNGRLAVVDITDFDAPCRAPVSGSSLAGCAPPFLKNQVTSQEVSCNVVAPNEPRSSHWEAVGTNPGNHVPGIQTYPLLYNNDGSVFVQSDTEAPPTMVATLPKTIPASCTQACDPMNCGTTCDTLPGCPLELFVGGVQTPLDVQAGICSTVGGFTPGAVGQNNALAMNLEDLRAHIIDQNWTVTFEGPIPAFAGRLAYLTETGPGTATLSDPESRFCDNGVLSQAAMTEMLAQQPSTTLKPADVADYVQITNDIPDSEDPYWNSPVSPGGGPPACTYADCFDVFGPIDAIELATTRDLRITEAYQDHVEVTPRAVPSIKCDGAPCAGLCVNRNGKNECVAPLDEIKCCFPAAVAFSVRVGNQWAVWGDQVGFLHHVVADQDTGVCRNACDPTFNRKNARLIETTPSLNPAPILDRDPTVVTFDPSPTFLNPMFRFGIYTGMARCASDTDCATSQTCTLPQGICVTSGGQPATKPTPRDAVFKFSTNGSFAPLLTTLSTDTTVLAEPQGITYSRATQEVAITDGYLSGLIMVSLLAPNGVSRSFF